MRVLVVAECYYGESDSTGNYPPPEKYLSIQETIFLRPLVGRIYTTRNFPRRWHLSNPLLLPREPTYIEVLSKYSGLLTVRSVHVVTNGFLLQVTCIPLLTDDPCALLSYSLRLQDSDQRR